KGNAEYYRKWEHENDMKMVHRFW
ncbi:MAG: hypothetical protein J07AB43_05810, partial [Candidatus Nanosalina sp. J07AB43]